MLPLQYLHRAPGKTERPPKRQEGRGREREMEVHRGWAVMMDWLMNANEDEYMWQIQITRRMWGAARLLHLLAVAENTNSRCVSGLLIPEQRQRTHRWTRYGSIITNHMAQKQRPPVFLYHPGPNCRAGGAQVGLIALHPDLCCQMDWVLELTIDQCTSSSSLCS